MPRHIIEEEEALDRLLDLAYAKTGPYNAEVLADHVMARIDAADSYRPYLLIVWPRRMAASAALLVACLGFASGWQSTQPAPDAYYSASLSANLITLEQPPLGLIAGGL